MKKFLMSGRKRFQLYIFLCAYMVSFQARGMQEVEEADPLQSPPYGHRINNETGILLRCDAFYALAWTDPDSFTEECLNVSMEESAKRWLSWAPEERKNELEEKMRAEYVTDSRSVLYGGSCRERTVYANRDLQRGEMLGIYTGVVCAVDRYSRAPTTDDQKREFQWAHSLQPSSSFSKTWENMNRYTIYNINALARKRAPGTHGLGYGLQGNPLYTYAYNRCNVLSLMNQPEKNGEPNVEIHGVLQKFPLKISAEETREVRLALLVFVSAKENLKDTELLVHYYDRSQNVMPITKKDFPQGWQDGPYAGYQAVPTDPQKDKIYDTFDQTWYTERETAGKYPLTDLG